MIKKQMLDHVFRGKRNYSWFLIQSSRFPCALDQQIWALLLGIACLLQLQFSSEELFENVGSARDPEVFSVTKSAIPLN